MKKMKDFIIILAALVFLGGGLLFSGAVRLKSHKHTDLWLQELYSVLEGEEYVLCLSEEGSLTGNRPDQICVARDDVTAYTDGTVWYYFDNGRAYEVYEEGKVYCQSYVYKKDWFESIDDNKNNAEFVESYWNYGVDGLCFVEEFKVYHYTYSLYFSGNVLKKVVGESSYNVAEYHMEYSDSVTGTEFEKWVDLSEYGQTYRSIGEPLQREIILDIHEKAKPAIMQVILATEGNDDIRLDFSMRNTYGIDVMSTDVIGMVGVPIAIDCKNRVNAKLSFYYNVEELDCDEEELVVLYQKNGGMGPYNDREYLLDKEKHCITTKVLDGGTYILENGTVWDAVWNGTYEYENEILEPECNWHDEFYYEDVERLADISLYDGSGEYHIKTVHQLAGLVKLVNEGNSFSNCDFYLEDDLDLEGLLWAPIGWYHPADGGYMSKDFPFQGRFYGQNHIIYHLNIIEPDHSGAALFGRTMLGFLVKDLGLVDCHIEGGFYSGAFLGDNINSGENYDMENCFVTGVVKGGLKSGAFIGSSAYLKMKDCYALLTDESVMEMAGDLRRGSMENCHLNDEASVEKLQNIQ